MMKFRKPRCFDAQSRKFLFFEMERGALKLAAKVVGSSHLGGKQDKCKQAADETIDHALDLGETQPAPTRCKRKGRLLHNRIEKGNHRFNRKSLACPISL